MIEWLYRRRDPAAAGATIVLMAISLAVWRFVPHRVATPPQAQEMVVRMEELPPEPPPAPPPPPPPTAPPPPPQTPPPPAPAPPRPAPAPAEPTPSPSPAPAPVATPAPPAPAPPATHATGTGTDTTRPSGADAATARTSCTTHAGALLDNAYVTALRGKINDAKHYPSSREARQLRPAGTVRVWLEIDRGGQLLGSGVEAGSGSPILDGEALRFVRLSRYAAFEPDAFNGQASHRFVVSMEFIPPSN